MSDKQRLDENPLIVALMGALVGMGLERNKAQRAAQQAVADAGANAGGQQAARPVTGGSYTDTMRRGSRGDGVRALQRKLGMLGAEQDGIYGPKTERAVRTFQQSQGLQVDGVVGPETRARIEKLATASESIELDEDISITGEVEDLIRMMQLAGADGAKAVDADDINPGPKPCPICGKMHGPSQPMGGCGSKPKEPGMGDMIKMISSEEEELDGDFQDASTEPDEEYANDVSASIPAGDDLHKKKKAYPAVDGGDNPMTAENLQAKLKELLDKE